jgi:hypothetical protein
MAEQAENSAMGPCGDRFLPRVRLIRIPPRFWSIRRPADAVVGVLGISLMVAMIAVDFWFLVSTMAHASWLATKAGAIAFVGGWVLLGVGLWIRIVTRGKGPKRFVQLRQRRRRLERIAENPQAASRLPHRLVELTCLSHWPHYQKRRRRFTTELRALMPTLAGGARVAIAGPKEWPRRVRYSISPESALPPPPPGDKAAMQAHLAAQYEAIRAAAIAAGDPDPGPMGPCKGRPRTPREWVVQIVVTAGCAFVLLLLGVAFLLAWLLPIMAVVWALWAVIVPASGEPGAANPRPIALCVLLLVLVLTLTFLINRKRQRTRYGMRSDATGANPRTQALFSTNGTAHSVSVYDSTTRHRYIYHDDGFHAYPDQALEHEWERISR